MPPTETAHFIHPDQLQIGLFIHLDLHWMAHPFTFGSFKIKSVDQIDTLKKLGLSQIRYSPTKSDAQPLAVVIIEPVTAAEIPSEATPEPIIEPEIDPALQAILAAKRQRLAQHEHR